MEQQAILKQIRVPRDINKRILLALLEIGDKTSQHDYIIRLIEMGLKEEESRISQGKEQELKEQKREQVA